MKNENKIYLLFITEIILSLNREQGVQVSDTTKLYSITTAKFINKKPAVTAG